MVGWPHPLNGHEFEQAPGDGDGREGWRVAVHGVPKSRIRISDSTTTRTQSTESKEGFEKCVR